MEKIFICDAQNDRLVLVASLWPTRIVNGTSDMTPNSNQNRLYHSLFIWEDVIVDAPDPADIEHSSFDYIVFKSTSDGERGNILMRLPSEETVMLYGQNYLYNEK